MITSVKHFAALIITLTILFLFENSSYAATTYYVRKDGGSSTQCTGTADAPYPGSGTGQACAFSHPNYALSVQGNNPTKMVGGDTLIIDGSNGASYVIGLTAPNIVDTGKCAAGWPWDCFLRPIPSGPSPTQPTRILGKGWNSGCSSPPQLWGNERVAKVLNLNGSNNVELQCLDITDHSACQEFGKAPCNRDSAPYGPWAVIGIQASDSSNVLLNNVNIHGLAKTGIQAARIKDWTIQNSQIVANPMVGWDGDMGATTSSNSGTITFDHVRIEYNGCGETYPGKSPYNCYSQSQGGYGDAIGTQKTGGNWIFNSSNISHNTSDGIDLLYHDGNGTVTVKRSRVEGNAGNQVKSATNTTIDNSIIIGNCGYFKNNPITWQSSGFDHCRAQGNSVALSYRAGMTASITNSTITGNGDSLIISMGSGCNGSESLKSLNNIYLAGTDLLGGDLTGSYFASGATGNGDGPCANVKLIDDYSIFYGTKSIATDCSGRAHSKCVNPMMIEPITSLFTGNAYNANLQSASPAIGSGTVISGASALDYNNYSRGSSWDIGALQYGSVPGGTGGGTNSAVCGNGVVESQEQCDTGNLNGKTCAGLGFAGGGTLSCSSTCSFNTTGCTSSQCGNGTIDTGEQCDGKNLNNQSCADRGFIGGGSLACAANCVYDTSGCQTTTCGNGKVDTGEQCDGTNLNNQSCTTQGFTSGTLGCTNTCVYDTSSCAKKPVVTITSPTSNSVLTEGSDVVMAATATAFSTTVKKVYFYNDGVYLGSDADAPYTFTVGKLTKGAHTLSSEVVDNLGNWGSTASVNVNVESGSLCGNGAVDTGEECDGANLNNQSCTTKGFSGGTLSCSNCAFVTSSCVKKPEVTITSPTSSTPIKANSDVTMNATAAAYNATVKKVYFYDNGAYLGSDADAPYTFTVNKISSGNHTLSCEVVDSLGNWGSTASVNVNVQAGVICGNGTIDTGEQCDGTNLNNQSCTSQGYTSGTLGCTNACSFDLSACVKRPVVTITNPTPQTTLTAGTNVSIAATATAYNSTVNKVYFYDNGAYLGSSATAPYNYTLNKITAGAHTLSAEVVDAKGNWGQTASVAVNVQSVGPVCGNGKLETGEQCDGGNLNGQTCLSRGFNGGGTLSCTSSCTFNTTKCSATLCGNGVIDYGEQCEANNLNGQTCSSRGYGGGGTLGCTSSCTFDLTKCIDNYVPKCGNGIIDYLEQCDGYNLNSQTCYDRGYRGGGTLSCTKSCKFNTSGCRS